MLDEIVQNANKTGFNAYMKGDQQSYCDRVDVYSFILSHLKKVSPSKIPTALANRIRDKIYLFDHQYENILKHARPLTNRERNEAISRLYDLV